MTESAFLCPPCLLAKPLRAAASGSTKKAASTKAKPAAAKAKASKRKRDDEEAEEETAEEATPASPVAPASPAAAADPLTADPALLSLDALKTQLKSWGLQSSGVKGDLIKRFRAFQKTGQHTHREQAQMGQRC